MNFQDIGYLKDFPSFVDEGAPLCSEIDPEMFFPLDAFEGSLKTVEYYANEKEAKAICAQCPYKMQCLTYALERSDIQGIWGATTQMDRRRMMRRLRTRNIAKML